MSSNFDLPSIVVNEGSNTINKEATEATAIVNDDNDNDDNDDEDNNYMECMSFMFESNQPLKLEQYVWDIIQQPPPSLLKQIEKSDLTLNDNESLMIRNNKIHVSLRCVNDIPGAVQSGHYLWPGAKLLCDYLVNCYNMNENDNSTNHQNNNNSINGIIELGAGCALASLLAIQLYSNTIQYIIVTDHDPGTLNRACDNFITTLEVLGDDYATCSEQEPSDNSLPLLSITLNESLRRNTIDHILPIMVTFEQFEWGCNAKMIHEMLHKVMPFKKNETQVDVKKDDDDNDNYILILGSDLIYCHEVVRPLFQTVLDIMHTTATATSLKVKFILSQSFIYDDITEQIIIDIINEFHLHRTIVIDNNNDTTTNIESNDNNDLTTRSNGLSSSYQRVQEFVMIS